jgi:polysaccharide pyruvyl transferase CsaB
MPFSKIRNDKASPNLVLVGNFGAKNIGDELILAGFLRKLGKELPKAKVTVLGSDPHLVRRFHGVDALPLLPCGFGSLFRRGWWRSIRKMKKADAVIFPGGGLFTDEESFHAVLIWGFHLLAARYFWKPVYLLGQSIGPFHGEYAKDLVRTILKKTEWIGVRDQASVNELKRIGMSSSKIKNGRDSSYWLVDRAPKVRSLKKTGRIKILISLRSYPKISEDFFSELAKALDQISEQLQVRISFAEFGKSDLSVWKKVCRRSKHSKLWKVTKLSESADDVLKEVKKFDLVIGMRLHSIISARLTGTPSIAFAYSRKVKEFAEQNLDVENFKADKLVGLLK